MDENLSGDRADNLFLVRLRRLTCLGDGELASLGSICGHARPVRARLDIVREGDRPERLHILMSGWACRFKLLPDGRRQITAILLPGDICDLDSLYVGRSDYGVATLTACSMAKIEPRALRNLAQGSPAISEALGFLMAVDNAMMVERSACLGRRSAREHMAHFLCELLLRLTLVGQARGSGYILPITQDEIADVLGLTAVHVNRVMQGFKHDGVIDRSGNAVVICEWSVLRQIASFQPTYLHFENVAESISDIAHAPWALQAPQTVGIGFASHG